NKNTNQRPDPADFGDYRAYLRALVGHLKATDRRFSYRYFSKRAGFSSPNVLKLVIDGKRHISKGSVPKFARGLGLSQKERESFEALVQLGRARTDEERNLRYQRLRRLRSSWKDPVALSNRHYDVYSRWYVLPVREMLELPGFQEDPAWIARRLRPRIRPSQARRALKLLEKLGLAVRDAEGRLKAADTMLATEPTVHSLAARNYHRAMLRHAEHSLDGLPLEDRNLSSLTLTLTRKQYETLCGEIARFRRDLLVRTQNEERQGERQEVYVAGFQIFPVTGGEK
ncbi:MAG: TIGR02147 family protein, partial [Bdellovibrionota bacterium]